MAAGVARDLAGSAARLAAVAAEDAIQLVSPMTYGWPMTYGYGVVPVNNYAVRFDAAMAAYRKTPDWRR